MLDAFRNAVALRRGSRGPGARAPRPAHVRRGGPARRAPPPGHVPGGQARAGRAQGAGDARRARRASAGASSRARSPSRRPASSAWRSRAGSASGRRWRAGNRHPGGDPRDKDRRPVQVIGVKGDAADDAERTGPRVDDKRLRLPGRDVTVVDPLRDGAAHADRPVAARRGELLDERGAFRVPGPDPRRERLGRPPAPGGAAPCGASSAVTVIETSTTAVLPSTGVLVSPSQAAHSPSAGRLTRSSGTGTIIRNVSRVTLTPLITTSALRPPPSPRSPPGLRLTSPH